LIAGIAGSTRVLGTFYAENSATLDLVLYPDFQKAMVPGWLDKGLKWRHGASHFLDNTVLLAPDRDWLKTLPN
jgi:hypothetical protein